MRIINVIENHYNCVILSTKASLRGGVRTLYKGNANMYQLVLGTSRTLKLEINSIDIELQYIPNSGNDISSDNIIFLKEMISCLLETHEPWNFNEGLSNITKSSSENKPLEILLPQLLNTLLCSHLFDKAAVMLYNEKKGELKGLDIASIPPYDKEVVKSFRRVSVPISEVYINKIINDNRASSIDDYPIFEMFDTVKLENSLILSPLIIDDKFSGLLITYSPQPYGDKHIYSSNLSANFLSSFLTYSKTYNRYKNSVYLETESRQKFESTKPLAEIGSYVLTIAHEIRNPLTSIGGFAKRLLKAVNDPDLQKMINIISSESERLQQLTADILSYSKKNEPKKSQFSLYDELIAIRLLLEQGNKKQKIKIVVDKSTDIIIHVDKAQFRQVLINLIANSINAIDEQGEITLRSKEDNENFIISIIDTGKGISKENMKTIFEPFFTTTSHGTGLGLPISKEIMASHNGSIEVLNRDIGTEFRLIVPR